jgi:hypothetical protein
LMVYDGFSVETAWKADPFFCMMVCVKWMDYQMYVSSRNLSLNMGTFQQASPLVMVNFFRMITGSSRLNPLKTHLNESLWAIFFTIMNHMLTINEPLFTIIKHFFSTPRPLVSWFSTLDQPPSRQGPVSPAWLQGRMVV